MAMKDFRPGAIPTYPEQETAEYTYNSAVLSPYAPANGGHTAPLRRGVGSTPDAMRTGTVEFRDTYDGTDPSDFYRHRTDRIEREDYATDVRGGLQKRVIGERAIAEDPRRNPPPNTRMTAALSPSPNGHFYRDMNAGLGQREFTGEHRSMAGRKRDYEIYGMKPATTPRTTFRREVIPQVNGVYEVPSEPLALQVARVEAIVPTSRRRIR